MKVLVTGISGVGKSTLVGELRRRGYSAFDVDDDGLSVPLVDGTWGWRLADVRALLERYEGRLVFLAGCSEEQAALEWDLKVLLTATSEVIIDRLIERSNNPFGKTKAEQTRVLSDMEWVLPLLRESADLEIDTTSQPPAVVADAVIEAVRRAGGD